MSESPNFIKTLCTPFSLGINLMALLKPLSNLKGSFTPSGDSTIASNSAKPAFSILTVQKKFFKVNL